MRTLFLVLLTCALAVSASLTNAQSYPNRPIRLIIPYGPGQSTDITGRIIGRKLGENLGQPIVVDNRQGADGVLGASLAARAAPDGYTLLLGTSATHGAAIALFSKLPYDPVNDFAPISQLVTVFYILVVGGNHAVSSIADLISAAKAQPGKLTIANTSGIGYLTGELFKQASATDMTDVPYKVNASAFSDLATGRVDAMFVSPAAALPQIKAGRFKALAITAPKRSILTPGVPTIAESGFPGFVSTPSPALFAPARTPPDIVTRLNNEVVRVLKDPEIREILLRNGTSESEIVGSTPDELHKLIRAELVMWARVVQQAKIRRRD